MNLAKKSIFRSRYKIFERDSLSGLLFIKLVIGKASFFNGKDLYKFFREKPLEGTFFLKSDNTGILAVARKTYGVGLEYTVTYNDLDYTLKPGRLYGESFHPHFEFFENGELRGTIIRKESIFPLKYYFEYDFNLPIEIQAFNFWLSMLIWYNE